jgi:hypothetical protein
MNNAWVKTMHRGTIDRGFTVYISKILLLRGRDMSVMPHPFAGCA